MGFLQVVNYGFLFQMISEKTLSGKDLLAIREKSLYEHYCNYISYKFSYKFAVSNLLSICKTFSKSVVW